MTIISQNSVLILGAGTSYSHNLPLGGELIDAICKQIQNEKSSIVNNVGQLNTKFVSFGEAYEGHRSSEFFLRQPILSSLFELHPLEGNRRSETYVEEVEKLMKLGDLLKNQTSETIDDFIAMNPSYADLVKICISIEFFRSLYIFDKTQFGFSLKAIDARNAIRSFQGERNARGKFEYYQERNWVHLLINMVRHGIRENLVSSENKILVVSFNYDNFVESILSKQFNNIEERIGEWENYIEIIHPHGSLGKLDDKVNSPAKLVVEWAKEICVVNEKDIPKEIESARKLASNYVQNSSIIYAVGFAFSGPNCRLLGLNHASKLRRKIQFFYANYDGNIGLTQTLERLKIEIEKDRHPHSGNKLRTVELIEHKGSKPTPLNVVDWFRMGHLGEMPG